MMGDREVDERDFPENPVHTYLYRPLVQLASSRTLPAGLVWNYAEAPAMGGLINWFDLPQSRYPFGIIRTDRELTREECSRFGLANARGDATHER